jgi:hypothetical protein
MVFGNQEAISVECACNDEYILPMHRLEYSPDVIFHCIVCFRNGKVKPTVLRKAEIEVFILERNNIKLLE